MGREADRAIFRQRQEYFAEWLGIAEADDDEEIPAKALVFIQTPMGMGPYELTGLLVVQTAMSILFDENIAARKMGGGVLTPATVVTPAHIQALERAGLKIEAKIVT